MKKLVSSDKHKNINKNKGYASLADTIRNLDGKLAICA
jgi:hypothetical protein